MIYPLFPGCVSLQSYPVDPDGGNDEEAPVVTWEIETLWEVSLALPLQSLQWLHARHRLSTVAKSLIFFASLARFCVLPFFDALRTVLGRAETKAWDLVSDLVRECYSTA